TACTSENLLLRRKTSRKLAVCRRVRRNCHHLFRITPQDQIEKIARMMSTTFEIGLELARISRSADPEFVGNKSPIPWSSRAMAGIPGVRNTDLRNIVVRAPLGQRSPVWDSRRLFTGWGARRGLCKTVSRHEIPVKPMLILEFSSFS